VIPWPKISLGVLWSDPGPQRGNAASTCVIPRFCIVNQVRSNRGLQPSSDRPKASVFPEMPEQHGKAGTGKESGREVRHEDRNSRAEQLESDAYRHNGVAPRARWVEGDGRLTALHSAHRGASRSVGTKDGVCACCRREVKDVHPRKGHKYPEGEPAFPSQRWTRNRERPHVNGEGTNQQTANYGGATGKERGGARSPHQVRKLDVDAHHFLDGT
jgi:hypothetical protein